MAANALPLRPIQPTGWTSGLANVLRKELRAWWGSRLAGPERHVARRHQRHHGPDPVGRAGDRARAASVAEALLATGLQVFFMCGASHRDRRGRAGPGCDHRREAIRHRGMGALEAPLAQRFHHRQADRPVARRRDDRDRTPVRSGVQPDRCRGAPVSRAPPIHRGPGGCGASHLLLSGSDRDDRRLRQLPRRRNWHPLALLFGQQLLGRFIPPAFAEYLPHTLTAVAPIVGLGQPLPSSAALILTTALSVGFIATAIWRFGREEL